jgi:hypothetical protein
LPTNTRFLAAGYCPSCRLAMVKADVAAWQEAEATEPTMTDDELDEMWDAVRDHLG